MLKLTNNLYFMFLDKLLVVFKYWLLVFFWMALIFYFSSQPDLSSGLPHFYDLILRKMAHIVEYFILTFLLTRAFSVNLNKKTALIISAIVAIFYAASDEYHQTFVFGREGTPQDVLVDSIGILFFFIRKIRNTLVFLEFPSLSHRKNKFLRDLARKFKIKS